MNKYTTDYATCMDILTKLIILAYASSYVFSQPPKKHKELSYDPQTLKFSVTEYDLIKSDEQFISDDSMYYSPQLNLYFDKVIIAQDTEYDLTEAIEAYNSITIEGYE